MVGRTTDLMIGMIGHLHEAPTIHLNLMMIILLPGRFLALTASLLLPMTTSMMTMIDTDRLHLQPMTAMTPMTMTMTILLVLLLLAGMRTDILPDIPTVTAGEVGKESES